MKQLKPLHQMFSESVPVMPVITKSYARELTLPQVTAEDILAPLVEAVHAQHINLKAIKDSIEARYPIMATLVWVLSQSGASGLIVRLRLNGIVRKISADSEAGLIVLLDAVLDRRSCASSEKTVV